MTSKVKLVPIRALAQAWADLTRKKTGSRGRTGAPALKVFLDCERRFQDAIRSEVDFVEYVSDRRAADVRVSVMPVRPNTKDHHCIVTFIGAGRFEHIEASARLRLAGPGETSKGPRNPVAAGRGRNQTRTRSQNAPASAASTPPSNSVLTFPSSSVTFLPSSGRGRAVTRHAR